MTTDSDDPTTPVPSTSTVPDLASGGADASVAGAGNGPGDAAEANLSRGDSAIADEGSPLAGAMSPAASGAVNRWATEHYGFDEDPIVPAVVPAALTANGSPASGGTPPRFGKRALLAAGVLGAILTGAMGGVAIAASGDGDGAGGDRGGVVRFDQNDGGDFDGGRFR